MPEPASYNLLEQEKPALVERDHLPRAARYRVTYDDGSSGETQQVLYWGGQVVQSMLAADWLAQRGPLPVDPTQGEIDAAVAAIDATVAALAQAAAQAAADAAQLRQQVLALAQSAVGVRVDSLTAGQVRALFAIILRQAGALKNDLTVRPLNEWVQ